MSITAQSGIVGFCPQVGKEVMPDVPAWFRHRATLVDLDILDDVRECPPEVGGIAVPTFPYKGGPVVTGGFTIQPRYESTLGWLLYALMGDVSSAEVGSSSGIYDHTFKFLASDASRVKWMAFRKLIPAGDTGVALGQQFIDNKLVGFALTLPNDAPLAARVDAVGRGRAIEGFPLLVHDPSAWADEWENTFEHWESIPVATHVDGFLKIADEDLPVVGATITFQNVPLDIRQERVYGDPYLEDVTIVQRRLSYDVMVKWNNPQLYARCLTGAIDGTIWDTHPYTGTLKVRSCSSVNMTGEDEPWRLDIDAAEVMMSHVGGIQLAGNQSVLLRFAGVALESDTEYATFKLRNKIEEYVWPEATS